MPFANSSQLRLAAVVESVFGTTPTNPSFKTVRATNGGLRLNKTTVVSDERFADRNVRDVIQTGQDWAGEYGVEMSYASFDDFIEATLQGTWASDVLKNGVTQRSFTVEEFLEMGATDSYARVVGVVFDKLSLSLSAREKVTGSFGVMGRVESLATAALSGATYAAPNDNPIFNATAHVADLTVLSLTAPKIRSLSVEMVNGIRTRPVVGSLYSEQFGSGRFEVTGTLEAYFESNAAYQAVLDHANGALSFTIGQDTGEKYTIELPKIIFLNGERQVGGNDEDVMVSIPFQGVYDTTEACTVKITRAVA